MPDNIFRYIQGMGGAEPAGEESAPSHRRTLGIQYFIENPLNLFDILLNAEWHKVSPPCQVILT